MVCELNYSGAIPMDLALQSFCRAINSYHRRGKGKSYLRWTKTKTPYLMWDRIVALNYIWLSF